MSRESRAERRRRERSGGSSGDARPPAGGDRGEPGRGGAGPGSEPERVVAGRVIWLAALFALVGGFVEAGLIRYVLSLGIPLRVSPHFLWMTPVAHLWAFAIVAVALLVAGRAWRKAATLPVVVGVFAGFSTYSVLLSVEFLHALAAPVLAAGVGVQMGWLARKRVGGLLARYAPVGVVALAVLLGAVAARSMTEAGRAEAAAHDALPAAPESPNVLLIILDTVRAASLGLHDALKSNSPRLEALAGEGVTFDRAYSPSPWTLPAHATIFTGVWPHQHGADWKRPLDGRHPTVAGALAASGFATAGFVGNLTWADRSFGLERGFARYDDYPISAGQVVLSSGLGRSVASIDGLRSALGLHDTLNRVPARVVSRRFLRWHERLPGDRPFFAFLNYYDAHEPVAGSLEPAPLVPVEHRNSLLTGALAQFSNESAGSQDRFLREYEAAYEAAIGELDRELGTLFDELARRGVLDNTVVIVTSDHGEQIGEHNLFGHTSSLYEPALWIPLLIRYPDGVPGGLRIVEEVSVRNLPATMLDLAGVDRGVDPADCCPGRSLARHWRSPGDGAESPDSVFAHLTRGADSRLVPWAPIMRGTEMASVLDSGHQYILNGDRSEELYDLGEELARRRNLAGDDAARGLLGRLRGLLQRLVAGGP